MSGENKNVPIASIELPEAPNPVKKLKYIVKRLREIESLPAMEDRRVIVKFYEFIYSSISMRSNRLDREAKKQLDGYKNVLGKIQANTSSLQYNNVSVNKSAILMMMAVIETNRCLASDNFRSAELLALGWPIIARLRHLQKEYGLAMDSIDSCEAEWNAKYGVA